VSDARPAPAFPTETAQMAVGGRCADWLTVVSFLLLGAALCVFDVESVDFGWHLETGQLIGRTGQIPTHDPYSYIAEGSRWIDSHWLFQLVVYRVYEASGIAGVVWLRALVVAATFGVLLFAGRRRAPLPVIVAVGTLALFASYGRFVVRPELFSILFLAVFLRLSEELPARPRLALVAVPLCQAVWANMHGLYVLGILLLALFLMGDALQWFAARRMPRFFSGCADGPRIRRRALLVLLAGLASLLNANGLDGILYPLTLFGELRGAADHLDLGGLGELRSPLAPPMWDRSLPHPVAAYRILAVLSTVLLLVRFRDVRLRDVLPFLAFLYLSVLANRNIPLFAVVAAPMAIRNAGAVLDAGRSGRRTTARHQRVVCRATAAATLALAAAGWSAAASGHLYERVGWRRTFGAGWSEDFPGTIVGRLAAVEGNFFNSPDLGGYLIWRLYPEKQVAIDGRWEVYGHRLPGVLRAFRDPEVFADLAERHDVSAVVLSRTGSLSRVMGGWLRASPGWRLTARARNGLVFERTDRAGVGRVRSGGAMRRSGSAVR